MIYTVVMVSYNRDIKLREAVRQLLATSLDFLVIVDNNSKQQTRDVLFEVSQNDKRVKLIQLEENRGASFGFFTGLNYIENKHPNSVTIFLDDDAYFTQNFLDVLKKNIGLNGGFFSFITPKVVNKNGMRLNMNRPMTIIPNGIRKMFSYLRKRRTFGDNNESVEAASFIGLTIVNNNDFKKSALIPVDYFIYYDDLTYTYRLSKHSGMPGIYISDLLVIHDMASGTREYDSFRLSYLLTNSRKFSKEVGDRLFIYSFLIHCYHFLNCFRKLTFMVFIKALMRKK